MNQSGKNVLENKDEIKLWYVMEESNKISIDSGNFDIWMFDKNIDHLHFPFGNYILFMTNFRKLNCKTFLIN